MEKYIDGAQFSDEHLRLMKNHIMFKGLDTSQIRLFMNHAQPYFLQIEEGQTIRLPAELSDYIGLVFSGHVIVYGVDYSGNRLLHNSLESSESSGTLFSILDYRNTLVEVEGKVHSLMLMLDRSAVYKPSGDIIEIQNRILVNMIDSQRQMFTDLSWHLYCLCQRTIRDKILKLLQFCVERHKSYEFDIPFSREDMANYLAVDRASLSRSLSELKSEGIIDFRKNHFSVLSPQHFKYN